MAQDLRFALRLLLKDRAFTATAILALSLGIGANNTMFTIVNAVLLRGLPFEDSHQIMYLNATNLAEGQETLGVSYADFEEWRAETRSFAGLGAFRTGTMNVSEDGRAAERASGSWLTANTFSMLGQEPLLGRGFHPEEDRPGAEPVVILGHGLWKSRYGSDPGVLGRTIRVNELPSTIIGVMPDGMKFPTNADMWQALVPGEDRLQRDRRRYAVFGRLRDGVGPAEAQAEMSAIAERLAQQYPDTNRGIGARVMPYNDRFTGGEIRLVFTVLMGAVGFVLLIACANVANLLLARSAHRATEIAVRVAIGASRARIVRQLLIESVVLGLLSGLGGLLLSIIGVRLFALAVEDVGKPYWITFTMDASVFGFLAAVCLLTGVLFGLVPALQISKTGVTETLQEGGRSGTAGARARRFTSTIVVAELVLTIVLLAGAGLMIRSFFKLYTLDLGIRPEGLLTMRLGLAERKYPEPAHRIAFHERLADRLTAVPGLRSASIATSLPADGGDRQQLDIEARALPPGDRGPEVTVVVIGSRYFQTLDVPLRRGRPFNEADGQAGSETAIVNERLAERHFPGEDPIGRRIRLREDDGPEGPWLTIVGVGPTIRQRSIQEMEPDPVVYLPYRHEPAAFVSILARGHAEPAALTASVRGAVQEVDPDLPVYSVLTLEERLAETRWAHRIFGSMFTIFAFIALVLSAIGIYGVMAYGVSQRTQELGVRMALGASAVHISWLVLRQGLVHLAVGLLLGLAAALAVSRVLQSLLAQISPTDPLTFAVITVLLVAVVFAACMIPARRASGLDPMPALRNS